MKNKNDENNVDENEIFYLPISSLISNRRVREIHLQLVCIKSEAKLFSTKDTIILSVE